jgi:hypothetical protein
MAPFFNHDLTTRHWPAVEPGTVEIRDEDKQKAAEATPNPCSQGLYTFVASGTY